MENSQLLVAIAVPFDQDIDAVGERARNTVLGIGMLALALVAGVGYFAITNTFRPLHDIENTASKIAAGDLSQRVSTYPSNTELGRLSAALNTMLGHIEDSFDGRKQSEKRIRQFVSDASHELRTPLVTIRGYAELYRQGAITDPDQVGQAMERMESGGEADDRARRGPRAAGTTGRAPSHGDRSGRHDAAGPRRCR